jgi:hypothetical protein
MLVSFLGERCAWASVPLIAGPPLPLARAEVEHGHGAIPAVGSERARGASAPGRQQPSLAHKLIRTGW